MTGQSPPSLWLACGKCMANLARATPAGWQGSARRRLLAGEPLPGENFVVRKHGGAKVHMRPRRGNPAEWVYFVKCPCGADWRPSGPDIARWWDAFAASGKMRDTIYLGRDRLFAVRNCTPYADRNCMGRPGDHAR